MDILLYTNNSDSNVLNKDIVLQSQLVCYANKENIDILSPDILLSYIDIKALNINYCYIKELNRYYYINSYKYEKNHLLKLTLQTDVLMTFRDNILLSSGIVKNTKNIQNYNSNFEVLDTSTEKIITFENNLFSNENKLYLVAVN